MVFWFTIGPSSIFLFITKKVEAVSVAPKIIDQIIGCLPRNFGNFDGWNPIMFFLGIEIILLFKICDHPKQKI